jgi:hypothetical protein
MWHDDRLAASPRRSEIYPGRRFRKPVALGPRVEQTLRDDPDLGSLLG